MLSRLVLEGIPPKGPPKWVAIDLDLVPSLDTPHHLLVKVADGGEAPGSEHSFGDNRKDDLDLIDPRRMQRRLLKLESV